MHIVLTHEQADFDALASLLCASLLYERAIPVLPRRMNRNVRAFLTLYGANLPFMDPRDLSGDPIETITLVDTQSMISLKGMSPQTHVRVIDHHPPRENLPPDWQVTTMDLGATTTFLLEALRERNGQLTPVQATLMLLGIYEDTGSLTYTRTTARDLQAAAFLIEQGASLKIASDFLNHPLSVQQQALYDRLRDAVEFLDIHGHTIIVSTGDAEKMEEELSTVVHKLRDLLDPDALIVLIKTRGGVQLIARSTSDQIDVAELASMFGGGGHARAAAGLIRDGSLEDIHAELVRILPERVHPAVTVSQIMSRGPQLLESNTPVDEAAQRMRRYGYEGYPVVQNGHLVGLLTRRAVDRALGHKLNLNAASLMEAGNFTVNPGDSIEKLQRVMTESGWGQIPVVDPESQEIFGIVTRTDLLKTLTPQPEIPGRQNLASRLEAALPPIRLALLKAVAQEAHNQHIALYIVGGLVRDLLLDRPSQDLDLVVEGDAIALADALCRRYGGRITTHARFSTAKWHIGEIRSQLILSLDNWARPVKASGGERRTRWPSRQSASRRTGAQRYSQSSTHENDLPETLDLVSARTEFYTYPTALPTVERGSIKLDLHRRDFTINTLALRLDGHHYGELHDYWGGLSDIKHKLVRVLHSLSFVDDPTRMLRAVRFEQRFQFQIEERTLELMKEAQSLLDRVSGDRIRHEFDHIFEDEAAGKIMERLDQLGLLLAIHPALSWDAWLGEKLQMISSISPSEEWELALTDGQLKRELSYCLWLLRLDVKFARQIRKRLKLSASLSSAVEAACKLWQTLPEIVTAPASQVVKLLENLSPLARYAVYLACDNPHSKEQLYSYASKWRKVTPTIDGHDLQQRGLPPGPIYRTILERLRAAWLDGEVNNADEENQLLELLLREV
ncbi:MAG: CBS domain-containing protein [Anaerolineales bacterium]|jgi:tRNA nucleotidyltransferase (CCA-adding enzyme)